MFWNDFGIKGVVPKLKRGGCQYQNHYQIIFSLVNLSEKMLTKIAKYGIQYSTTLWNTLNVQSHFLFYCFFFLISLSFLAFSNSAFFFFLQIHLFLFFTFSFFSDLSCASSIFFTVSGEVSNWFGNFGTPLHPPHLSPQPPGPISLIHFGNLIKSLNLTLTLRCFCLGVICTSTETNIFPLKVYCKMQNTCIKQCIINSLWFTSFTGFL